MQLATGDVARHAHSSSGRDARLTGIDLSGLSGALNPSVVVTAADLARPACAFPNSKAGDLLLARWQDAALFGSAGPGSDFEDFDLFDQARLPLGDAAAVKFGTETGPVKMPNYCQFRFTRVGGPTPDAPDYSPVKNGSGGLGSSRARGGRSWRAGGFQASPHQQQFCLFWRRFRCCDHTPFSLYAALAAMFFANVRWRLANIARAVSIENQDPNRQSWKLPIFTNGRPIEQIRKKPPGEEPSGFYNRGNASHDGTAVNSAERALVPPIPEPLSPNRRWGVASTEL